MNFGASWIEDLRSARRMELKAKAAFCGGFYEEEDHVFVSGNTMLPDAHFNRISLLKHDALEDRDLACYIGRFPEHTPIFLDVLHPAPDALRRMLESNGLHYTGELRSSMMLDNAQKEAAPPAGFAVEPVHADTLDVFLELFLRGFATPEELVPLATSLFHDLVLRHWKPNSILMRLGILRGEPACTAYLFLEQAEGGVNMVSTKEQLRGRGLATAMMRHLIGEAMRLGVQRLSLETRANSAPERLYASLGFAVLARHEIFTNAPDVKYGL